MWLLRAQQTQILSRCVENELHYSACGRSKTLGNQHKLGHERKYTQIIVSLTVRAKQTPFLSLCVGNELISSAVALGNQSWTREKKHTNHRLAYCRKFVISD
jgi:hypothetical protein